MPMKTIPVTITSVRLTSRASVITEPSPVCTPTVSPTTRTTQASPRAIRIPAKMEGNAAGRTTL